MKPSNYDSAICLILKDLDQSSEVSELNQVRTILILTLSDGKIKPKNLRKLRPLAKATQLCKE